MFESFMTMPGKERLEFTLTMTLMLFGMAAVVAVLLG